MCSRSSRPSSARLPEPERVRIRLPASFACASIIAQSQIVNCKIPFGNRQNPILQKLSCCEVLALEARKKGKKQRKGNLEQRIHTIHSLRRVLVAAAGTLESAKLLEVLHPWRRQWSTSSASRLDSCRGGSCWNSGANCRRLVIPFLGSEALSRVQKPMLCTRRTGAEKREMMMATTTTVGAATAAAAAAEGSISVQGEQLLVHGQPLLTHLHPDVVFKPDLNMNSGFLGASFPELNSRHVIPLGHLEGIRFMCCFRFKLWWMTQRMGSSGSEVPYETQFMLLEGPASDMYTVLLPIIEGPFRASLQGSDNNELALCLESGDPNVQTLHGLHALYINAGSDPFQVITDAVRAVESHLGTFVHREKKKAPGILDYFGWCTWDAFYTDVTAEGVDQGLRSLTEGGTPPRVLIIDDGWQSVAADETMARASATAVTQGTQYASRLVHIKENYKFQKNGKDGSWPADTHDGLQYFVEVAKQNYNLKYVYVWHALAGYWGGLQLGSELTEVYEPSLVYPVHSPGVLDNQPDMAKDSLTINGLGLVNPEKLFTFYNDLHSYLAAAGVDGVKVDSQNIIETLGAGYGGRVQLAQWFHEALEASIAQNFPDNGCISCMSHNTDNLYNSKKSALIRASDDFWPRDPASHTIHIASVAYNTLFLAEFMQPDWDMFQSQHPAAEYHAAARAVGGGPIYVSDKPGHHDFELLKKLVLSDGSVLRAQLPGRPTRDCLFSDPARDGKSLLKIWNRNMYGGVVAAFNCQGAGWCKLDKQYLIHDPNPDKITGGLCANDVEQLAKVAPTDWEGDCVIYSHRGGELVQLHQSAMLPLTLQKLEYEVFTVAPLKNLGPEVMFAPVGLVTIFNSGAAIMSLEYNVPDTSVIMVIRGEGWFGAFASQCPALCILDSVEITPLYEQTTGLLLLSLPVPQEAHFWTLKIQFMDNTGLI